MSDLREPHAIENEEEEEEEAKGSSQEERVPLLFVDVNLGGIDGQEPERIIVFEGDTAKDLAREFCDRHNLDEETEERLEALLNMQISTVLTKIQEEDQSP